MPGLFSSPDEVLLAQQQGQESQAENYAGLGGLGAGPYLGMRAGQSLGGLLSGPNPAMARSIMVQNALNEVGQSGQEIGTPKYFQALSQALTKKSLPADALSVQQFGAGLEKSSAEAAEKRAKAILDIAQAQKALNTPALENLPEAEKYRVLREVETRKPNPNPDTLKFYDDMIKLKSETERSQDQEAINGLVDLRNRIQKGDTPTVSEMAKGRYWYLRLTAPKIEPGSGAVIQHPGVPELDPSTNFGLGARGAPAPRGLTPGPAPTARPAGAPPTQVLPSGFSYTPGQARPGEQEIKTLSEGDALRGHLTDLTNNFSSEYVGPVSGRLGNLASVTTGNDPKQADFIAQANLFKNRMIKFITGAQMSEVETTRLVKEIPDTRDPEQNFKAKLKLSLRNIDLVTQAYQRNMAQGGIRQIGGNSAAPAAPAATPGRTQIGWTPDGRAVYRGANGKNYVD